MKKNQQTARGNGAEELLVWVDSVEATVFLLDPSLAGCGRETFASRQTDNKRRDRVTERHSPLCVSQSSEEAGSQYQRVRP